jgi:valyl-tRNA synthetase
VASSPEEALHLARIKTANNQLSISDIHQDEDVLDTWCSSWLWPISVFDGIRNPENPDIKYYYPTDDLVTAPEILFFWVARMIIAGYEFQHDRPFKNVYLTGIVRDKLGRKMSKSLGNSPDPIGLIETYGADGVRVGMLLCSPAGNDLLFDESLSEQGRNFGNKIWNAFRLVKSWEVDNTIPRPETAEVAIRWFDSLLNKTILELEDQFDKYRISEALMLIYKVFRDEFCSWYLEMIKPAYKHPIDAGTYAETLRIFDALLKLLHPFMPFITEEIWHYLSVPKENESIMMGTLPTAAAYDDLLINRFELAKEIITTLRNIRKEKNIQAREPLNMQMINDENGMLDFGVVIQKLCNLSSIDLVTEKPDQAISFIVKSTEYYVPMQGKIDVEEEIKKITVELLYNRQFLESVLKKLDNANFVNNAPDKVLQNEYNKKADAEARIQALEERYAALRNS